MSSFLRGPVTADIMVHFNNDAKILNSPNVSKLSETVPIRLAFRKSYHLAKEDSWLHSTGSPTR